MSATSKLAIRRTIDLSATHIRCQRRWARVHDVRFVTTHRDQERIIDRYKEKLQQKARQEGHESISSLKEAYQDKIKEARRTAAKLPTVPSKPSSTASESMFPQPPPPPPTPQAAPAPQASTQGQSKSNAPGIKPLSSYLDLEKVSSLPKKEVEYIWRLRHANDPLSLCAVVPLETYHRLYRTARTHPQFVLPLPRPAAEDGSGDVKQSPSGFEGGERSAADIHFLQWGFHPPAGTPPSPEVRTANNHTSTVLFTHLAAYKLHGAYAQPHTTITHHLDLADSHGIVLLNGSVVDGRGVSVEEGRWLLMCLQKFYDHEGHGAGVGGEKRQGLLKKFSNGDQGFDLEELVDEAERIS
ncbi:ATP synthase mitochondrial F1 complex assembly factor 1 [Exophiala viscosa]|uniref:ATP synthase mitochondrial F1 complex assembly factor 1 n=1 Tax=Exophiala viscosa TaxID=2486360 RepID=A0AAN6DXJ3_9EURO|nr:ATP synthase mitochondrial F1 complex assembly factor 1 [Exophiala viscosa]KAI1621431.1 ATP synthase mitochondrial F1 complex assembly factor 1 [Exophiala viscosa]